MGEPPDLEEEGAGTPGFLQYVERAFPQGPEEQVTQSSSFKYHSTGMVAAELSQEEGNRREWPSVSQ